MLGAMAIDKASLRDALADALASELDTLMAAQQLTTEGVTHADAKQEGSKDTRAIEASYLARGQAARVASLSRDLAGVRAMPLREFSESDRVALSALVTVLNEEQQRLLFIAPAGGGTRLELAGQSVDVVTPKSPLGRILVGAEVGDIVTWDAKDQDFDILELA